jgi:hypothetical protein
MPDRTISAHDLWSARLIVVFGTLMLVHGFVTTRHIFAPSAVDLAVSVAIFLVCLAAGRGLRRGDPWAWWAALGITLVALFFVAPVAGTIILGGGTEPVGTGWDVVFFPLASVILVGELIMLRWARKESRDARPRPTPRRWDI